MEKFSKEFCDTQSTRLKIHLVRYIPHIMKTKNWSKGILLQEKWFENSSNNIPGKYADINNIIKMDWVLSFNRAKQVYNKIKNDKIWINEAGKNSLIKEIKKMNLKLPTIDIL
jgi:hypothetical protein